MNENNNIDITFESEADEAIMALIGKMRRHPEVGLHWDDTDECRCVCGNVRFDEEGCPCMRGFEFCDASGNPIDGDSEFERCMKCGRVIQVYAFTPFNRVVNRRLDLIEQRDATAATGQASD